MSASQNNLLSISRLRDWKELSRQWPTDFWLVGGILVLMVLGLIMVASSSIAISEKRFGEPLHYLISQSMAMGMGAVVGYFVLKIPLLFWEDNRIKMFLFGILLLILVLIFGREIGGSKRWLSLGFMNFQVSEFIKMAVIIFMAGYLTRHASEVKESFQAVMRLGLPFGLMAILLLLEPDYGSTFVVAVIIAGMLLIAGAPWKFFVFTVFPMASLLVMMMIVAPYRRSRITIFLDPWADPFDKGYQLTQALIASGRGEWFGVGMGESVQKLLYLPDAHTDFLFSIFAEEFGLIGIFLLVVLYLFILYRCFRIGRKAFNKSQFFGGLIAYGVGIWIILQTIINMGVNLGLLPTKGLTLPFMSYGGSSLLMLMIAVAFVLRVDYETRHVREEEKSE
ncbi:MAG TPA: putative lipid II flippase FtsW [Thiomicrospira sp.]|jgi:cell division protein FtsW|nr:putative lipid II flippase FtsW [Thiomicrospira sp.]